MVFTSKWATRYFTARFLKTLLSGVLCLNLVLPAPLGPSPAYALRPISLQENSGLEESVSEALAPGAHRATLFGPPIFREGVSIYSVAHEGRQSRVRIQIASRRPIPSAAQVELLSSPVERWGGPWSGEHPTPVRRAAASAAPIDGWHVAWFEHQLPLSSGHHELAARWRPTRHALWQPSGSPEHNTRVYIPPAASDWRVTMIVNGSVEKIAEQAAAVKDLIDQCPPDTLAPILARMPGQRDLTRATLSGAVTIEYLTESLYKFIFKVTVHRTDGGTVTCVVKRVRADKADHVAGTSEIRDVERLHGRGAPQFGRAFKSADGRLWWIEEFIAGPTAGYLHEEGLLTTASRREIVGAIATVAMGLDGLAPRDFGSRGNIVVAPSMDAASVVDIGDQRLHVFGLSAHPDDQLMFLAGLLARYGYFYNEPDSNAFVFDEIVRVAGPTLGRQCIGQAYARARQLNGDLVSFFRNHGSHDILWEIFHEHQISREFTRRFLADLDAYWQAHGGTPTSLNQPRRLALELGLQTIMADGRVPLLSLDMDDTFLGYGIVLSSRELGILMPYTEARGHLVINTLADRRWGYHRVLHAWTQELHRRGHVDRLSRLHFIVAGEDGGTEVYSYDLNAGAYVRIAKFSERDKARGLAALTRHLQGRATLLAAYGDRFDDVLNDGSLRLSDAVSLAMNVGADLETSFSPTQLFFNTGRGGQTTTFDDIAWVTQWLRAHAPTGRSVARIVPPPHPHTVRWTFAHPADMAPFNRPVRVEVGGPGFVWAWSEAHHYLVPLVDMGAGVRYGATLPVDAERFTFFWTDGAPGHWEGRDFSIRRIGGVSTGLEESPDDRTTRRTFLRRTTTLALAATLGFRVRSLPAAPVQELPELVDQWQFLKTASYPPGETERIIRRQLAQDLSPARRGVMEQLLRKLQDAQVPVYLVRTLDDWKSYLRQIGLTVPGTYGRTSISWKTRQGVIAIYAPTMHPSILAHEAHHALLFRQFPDGVRRWVGPPMNRFIAYTGPANPTAAQLAETTKAGLRDLLRRPASPRGGAARLSGELVIRPDICEALAHRYGWTLYPDWQFARWDGQSLTADEQVFFRESLPESLAPYTQAMRAVTQWLNGLSPTTHPLRQRIAEIHRRAGIPDPSFTGPQGGLEEPGRSTRRDFLRAVIGTLVFGPIAADGADDGAWPSQAPVARPEHPAFVSVEAAYRAASPPPERSADIIRNAVAAQPPLVRAAVDRMLARLAAEAIPIYLVSELSAWDPHRPTTTAPSPAMTAHSPYTGRIFIAAYAPLFDAGALLHEGYHALLNAALLRPRQRQWARRGASPETMARQTNDLFDRGWNPMPAINRIPPHGRALLRALRLSDAPWTPEDRDRVLRMARDQTRRVYHDRLAMLSRARLSTTPTAFRLERLLSRSTNELLAYLHQFLVAPETTVWIGAIEGVRRADGQPLTPEEREAFKVDDPELQLLTEATGVIQDIARELRARPAHDSLRRWLTQLYVGRLGLADPWAAAPTQGGLEETGRQRTRREFLRRTGIAAALALFGLDIRTMNVSAAAPRETVLDKNRFLIGRSDFPAGWSAAGLYRGDVFIGQGLPGAPSVQIALGQVGRPALFLRLHDGVIYFATGGGALYRQSPRQSDQILSLDERPDDGVSTHLKDLAFSRAQAYVVVATSDRGQGQTVHTWRVHVYDMADPLQPALRQREELLTTHGSSDDPGVGTLAVVNDDLLAVSLGTQGVRLLRTSALDQSPATLPVGPVSAMLVRGSFLYVAEHPAGQRAARLSVWDLTSPDAPHLARATLLPTEVPVEGMTATRTEAGQQLWLTTGHTVLGYLHSDDALTPAGQLSMPGKVRQIDVAEGSAYVIQEFEDGATALHVIDIQDPARPSLAASYTIGGWGGVLLLTQSRSGRERLTTTTHRSQYTLHFSHDFREVATYVLPPFANPELRAVYTHDERLVTLRVVDRNNPTSPYELQPHAFYVFEHMTGRPLTLVGPDGETWAAFNHAPGNPLKLVVTESILPNFSNSRQVEIQYRPIETDAAGRRSLGAQETIFLTVAPSQGGLEESGYETREDPKNAAEIIPGEWTIVPTGTVRAAGADFDQVICVVYTPRQHASVLMAYFSSDHLDDSNSFLIPVKTLADINPAGLGEMHLALIASTAARRDDLARIKTGFQQAFKARGTELLSDNMDEDIQRGARNIFIDADHGRIFNIAAGSQWAESRSAIQADIRVHKQLQLSSAQRRRPLEFFDVTGRAAQGQINALVHALQDRPGVVVFTADALEQRTRIEQWLVTVPPAMGRRIIVYGSTPIRRFLEARGIRVETGSSEDLAIALLSMPAANRVAVVGELSVALALRSHLPHSMPVRHFDTPSPIAKILEALGLPGYVVDRLDLQHFDGEFLVLQAAA